MFVEDTRTPERILELVRVIVATELDISLDGFDNHASLRRKYNLDSVAAINILFALENELQIDIDTAAIANVDTALQIRDFLVALLNR